MPVTYPLSGLSSNKHDNSHIEDTEGKSEKKDKGEKGKKDKKGYSNNTFALDGSQVCYCPIPGKVAVTRPFIDKITITYTFPDDLELKGAVVECLKYEANEKLSYIAASQFKTGAVKYDACVHLLSPESEKIAFIQAGPKKPGLSHFLRLEFNPARLGAHGLGYLKAKLESVVPHDVANDGLNFNDILAKGTVSRVDIAVDLIGVQITALDRRFFGGGKSHWYFGENCETETEYFGLKTKNAPWIIYNKRQQLRDKERPTQFGPLSHTRLEYKATPKKRISELHDLKNPFWNVSLAVPPRPKNTHEYNWWFFLSACRLHGHEEALSQLPTDKLRDVYKQALDDAHGAFWKPETIWSQWPQALKIFELAGAGH